MAAELTNPASIAAVVGKNLIVHGKEILGDIQNAVNHYKFGQYKKFGEDCGKIAALVLS